MTQSLFDSFEPSSYEQWKQQAIKDLKGKNFEQTLLWSTIEGFSVEPYYDSEVLENLIVEKIQQVQNKNVQLPIGGWSIREDVWVENEKIANNQAIQAIEGGADAITFGLDGRSLATVNLVKLLDKIKLSETSTYFKLNHQTVELINSLKKIIGYYPKGGVVDDTLAQWMQNGDWHEDCWTQKAVAIRQTSEWSNFKVLNISSHHFHNAGANATQELAFLLASVVTYLDKLSDEGLTIEEIVANTELSVSIGTDYFMEIAKVRALRYLMNNVFQSFDNQCFNVNIHASTSTFYDAAITPYTNMLRATTEAMSAILGGCDSLTIHAYDATFSESSDFARRIARNVSAVLKEESYLDKTIDPAAGSYYVENLTLQLAQNAWALFQEVESRGGIVEAFKQNFVQDAIQKTRENRQANLESGKSVMVGVNKFRFDEEPFEKPAPDELVSFEKPTFKLLKNTRLAEDFEIS